MRDPARIAKVIDALRELWELEPDMRFIQLIANVTSASETNRSLWHMEEDELLHLIKLTKARWMRA